ncbi:unnamed protein product [Echinostoma caproni]|uniref:Conserved plasma membrane protein n=1 Tax=Echinostoma caproni TaxID=27848 RepID=A0A183AVX4_9TREM|nr:unnamed protein product [Echinostoma caproni]
MMGGGPMPREMMMHGRGMMMSDPDVPVMPFGDDQNEVPRSLNFDDNLPVPHMMPRMIAVRMQEPTWTERMGYGLRYVGSHPLVLLFSVTLIALCILFLVQLVVECRRRHRRNNPFQYNQFDQLPTYVEATMIKVPCDDDYSSEMVKEKSVKA